MPRQTLTAAGSGREANGAAFFPPPLAR